MAGDFNAGLQGAGQGAAAGSVAGPYGALIGAGVGFLGGYFGGSAENAAKKKMEERYKRAQMLAGPQHLADVVKVLQPLFRELVAAGLGPAFLQTVASNLAKHGYTGSAVGEALRNASAAVPDVTAFQGAVGEASNVVGREVNVELGAPAAQPMGNPLLEALLGGARGYVSGGGTFGASKPNYSNVDFSGAGRSYGGGMPLPTNMANPLPGVNPPPRYIPPNERTGYNP